MTKILVVDDDEDVRFTIRIALKSAGYDIFEASNGIEAETLLAKKTIDLVITDLVMPEKEGVALIHDLNQNFPDLKIIVITGGDANRSVDGERILDRENLPERASIVATYITLHKPFKLDKLLTTVEDFLSAKINRHK